MAPPSLGKEIEACDVTAGISAIKPGGRQRRGDGPIFCIKSLQISQIYQKSLRIKKDPDISGDFFLHDLVCLCSIFVGKPADLHGFSTSKWIIRLLEGKLKKWRRKGAVPGHAWD